MVEAMIAILEFAQIFVNVTAAVLSGEITQAEANEIVTAIWRHKEELEERM